MLLEPVLVGLDDCLQELRWLYDRRDLIEARRDLAAWLTKWCSGADLIIDEHLGDLTRRHIRADGNDLGRHHFPCFHSSTPALDRRAPSSGSSHPVGG